jgi:hypothetical protein
MLGVLKVWSNLYFLAENTYVIFTLSCKSMTQTFKNTQIENELDLQFTFSQLNSFLTDTVFVWWEVNETEACNCDGDGLIKGAYQDDSLKYYFHWTYSGDYCLPIEIMDYGTCRTVLYTEHGTLFPYNFSVIRFSLVSLVACHTHSHGVQCMGYTCTAAYKDYTESTR